MLTWKQNGRDRREEADEAEIVTSPEDPELVERPRRRRFTAEYKLGVLREADGCTKPGETGALLRREGLYSSHLTAWRKQRDEGALGALSKRRGRPAADPRDGEIARLRRRAERAEAPLVGVVRRIHGGARAGADSRSGGRRRRPPHRTFPLRRAGVGRIGDSRSSGSVADQARTLSSKDRRRST